jgi:hypothetical protein
MRQKTYLQTVALVFSVVAIGHILRLLNGWQVKISSFLVPTWVSWVAVVFAACLAYYGLKFVDKK